MIQSKKQIIVSVSCLNHQVRLHVVFVVVLDISCSEIVLQLANLNNDCLQVILGLLLTFVPSVQAVSTSPPQNHCSHLYTPAMTQGPYVSSKTWNSPWYDGILQSNLQVWLLSLGGVPTSEGPM
jgi:hypothetical protein